MSEIKRYKQVNRNDDSLTFGISRMEGIYDRRGGEPDLAHRHDFYTLLVVKKAKGDHCIDFNHNALADNQVYFISPGQVHQVIEKEKSFGYSIVFSPLFLSQSGISEDFIEDLNLFSDYGFSPPLELNTTQLDELTGYCEAMLDQSDSENPHKDQAIGAYLKLLCIACSNICTADKSAHEQESSNQIVRDFKKLVNQHYKEEHLTGHYADMLAISPDYLNKIIKSTIGKTAKEYIQSRIITEAKRLLCFTDLSSKEIGFELGFSEQSHFSGFFKKCTGLSSSQFRDAVKKSA